MLRRTTPIWSAVLVMITLLAAACGNDAADQPSAQASGDTSEALPTGTGDVDGASITLYSGRNEELVQPLIDQFEAATGIAVEVRYGSSAEMGAALLEEGDGTPADVFYSQEVGALGELDKAGLLAPLPDEVISRVPERFQPKASKDWVGVTGRSRVIVYNPDLVADPPATVVDLTDPIYADQVAWVPSNAGFQAFITAFRVTAGDDAARQWLDDMKANGAVSYEGNADVLQAVNNGDIGLGLINHYYWAQMLPEVGGPDGMTAQLIFPEGDDPGALVNATAAGLTAGAADDAAALAFIEYLLSEEGQTYFATETFEYPLVDGVADPDGVPALDDLQGPALDLTDLDSLTATQQMLTDAGLLS